jgi:SAM-dependent methyltransferase
MDEDGYVFPFGKNWDSFVRKRLNRRRIEISKKHILDFLEVPTLSGLYFLDVGCGSGLSSLAALEAGAAKIVSFDSDPDSVRVAQRVRGMKGDPQRWTILLGSVLDKEFLSSIEPADIVYSWGVLHHTGKMWEALENVSRLIKEQGTLYVALYVKTPKSDYWMAVKKKYNTAPNTLKRLMELRYFLRYTFFPEILHGRNPLSYVQRYESTRGMSYLTDLRDWLGGYPYEDAAIEEVLRFCRKRLNLELVKVATGQANAEYLFRRRTLHMHPGNVHSS